MNRAFARKNLVLEKATQHWKFVAPLLTPPKNEAEYNLLVKCLDELLDMIGDNENHPLMTLVDLISNSITSYDEKNFLPSKLSGISALKYLMELRDLNQSDLRMIGSQGVVSEILSGKRKLNLRQITALSKFFNVNPATFLDNPITPTYSKTQK